MRVRMKRTRNFTPPEERRITVKYREKQEYTVKREWGEAMVKDGDAEQMDPPSRQSDVGNQPGGPLPKAKAQNA